MKPTDLAYLAGLLDGKGILSVRLRKSDNAINTEVTVINTSPEEFRRFP